MSTKVGTLIREAREKTGMSTREFVKAVDKMWNNDPDNHISVGHLNDVENGKKSISINKLNLVTHALMKFGVK